MEPNLNGKKIVITGGCGFIGSHLVRHLTRIGARILVLKDKTDPCQRLQDSDKSVDVISCTFADPNAIRKALGEFRPEYVAHLRAAVNKDSSSSVLDELFKKNVLETVHLLNVAKEIKSIKRFVGFGSIEECAGGEPPFNEQSRDAPLSPYSISKLLSTKVMQYFFAKERLPIVVLRLSVVYGPAQHEGMFVPDLVTSCLAGRDFSMTEGTQTRDFIFVDDVIEAVLRSFVAPDIEGEIFHIGSGKPVTLKEVARKVHAQTKSQNHILFGMLPKRDSESIGYATDIRKAKKQLQWHPNISIEEGLKKTIGWYNQLLFGTFGI